jgi:hypothetical protein
VAFINDEHLITPNRFDPGSGNGGHRSHGKMRESLMFMRPSSKESGLGGLGFDFTPEGWSLPLDVEWNNGMVE